MAREIINVGATANDGTGDGLRTAYIKCNNNFKSLFDTTVTPTEIINGTSNVSVADSANVTISIAGSSNVVTFSGTETNISGNLTIATDLDVGNSLTITQDFTIGDQLIVNGTIGSNLLPDTSATYYLGNSTLRYQEVNSVLIDASGNITSGGNVQGGNIIALNDVIINGNKVTTGNVTAGNLITSGLIDATGNITGGNIITGGRITATGNVDAGNVNSSGVVATGDMSATGNVESTGGYFIGDGGFLSNVTAASNVAVTQIANGTSVVGISSSGGNVEITSGGTLVFQTDGTTVDVIVPMTTANITATGNISGTYILGDGSQLSNLPNSNTIVNGTSNVTVASNANTTVGVAGTTVLDIGSTGSAVTGLISATGNITATGNVAGGNIVTAGAVIGATVAGDGSALTALNGTNIGSGTVAAARVATLNQNTTGTAGGLSSAVTVELTGPVTGSATFTSAGDTASIGTTLTADPVITLTGAVTGSATMTNLGNVSIATTATSDPTITLAGDLTGSATLTNLGNATLTATIASNSVALGTDTTGSYVQQGATSGNGISGSVNSESGTFTVTSNGTDANTGSTLVFRDANGSFSANVITATATQARYADLAENYLADHDYDPGTVISIGGPLEITICGLGDYPAGVISTDPAYLMNSDLVAGLPVALVGRVPVRVFGSVQKGQLVYSDIMGRGSKNSEGHLVGIALEDNTDEGEKLVECMLKL